MRNPAGMPVVLVHNPVTTRITRQYYCLPCWDVISARAAVDVPALCGIPTENQRAQKARALNVLLGLEQSDVESTPGKHDVSLDMVLQLPAAVVESRIPFGRYHLHGEELMRHIEDIKRRME